jgi:hypothetical protein
VCLSPPSPTTSRSSWTPALLVELKAGNWGSLTVLCGLPQPGLKHLRTVGLREACERVKTFVTSPASKDDLDLLISLRDGVVHAAVNDQVEERLLVAYVLHVDSILAESAATLCLGPTRSETSGIWMS